MLPGKILKNNMFPTFSKFLNAILDPLKGLLRIIIHVTGKIFIVIGSALLQKKDRHQTIVYIIEHLFSSVEIYLKVNRVDTLHKLFVRFEVELASSNYNKVNWNYLVFELLLQMGCSFSDISYEKSGRRDGYDLYHIDITRTAIGNLEKATTPREPLLFEEKDAQWYVKSVLKLMEEGKDVSTEAIMKKLQISRFHAEELLEQIKRSGVESDIRKRKVMN